ncbi:MAG TPA: glucoamylase family protein, partial [Bacteroidales bacterium]|nr:glucoamylase family protein [Bacteroidales bacterium]
MKRFAILILVVFLAVSCRNQREVIFKSQGKIDFPITVEQELMLDSIQEATFRFFLYNHHPEMGHVKDRAAEGAPSSIASTGFALPSFAIGVERNWITREEAAQITLNVLNFFANSVQSADTNATGYQGFYYHFLRMDDGRRTWNCELSTIDTGLLMMGIIFARNYYNGDNETERQIRELAAYLLGRMNWNFFDMPEGSPHPHTISMGWTPEEGMINWGWHGYTEALFLYILAAGTGMQNVERSYDAWQSTYKWHTPYEGLSHVAFPPLFGHQFSHAFIDFRGLADSFMYAKGIDYFENSRRATLSQQRYAIDNPHGWVGYDSLTWGVTASDGPGEKYNF